MSNCPEWGLAQGVAVAGWNLALVDALSEFYVLVVAQKLIQACGTIQMVMMPQWRAWVEDWQPPAP